MPFVVSCACGKRFRAPDSSAGKRGKCSGCGAYVHVPKASADPWTDGLELQLAADRTWAPVPTSQWTPRGPVLTRDEE